MAVILPWLADPGSAPVPPSGTSKSAGYCLARSPRRLQRGSGDAGPARELLPLRHCRRLRQGDPPRRCEGDRAGRTTADQLACAGLLGSLLEGFVEGLLRERPHHQPPGPSANEAARSFLEASSGSERLEHFRFVSSLKGNFGDAGSGDV